MNLLARFEAVAERLFTGPFKKDSDRLQPVEIAKELTKSMLKHKQVSISQVYVPNIYRVFLNSQDWGPLASFGEAFLIELSKHLYAEGERYGYTFLTKPLIELHSDDTVNQNEMFIEVDFDDSVRIAWEDEEDLADDEPLWRNGTNIFRTPAPPNLAQGDNQGRNLGYFLEIIEGPDQGTKVPLATEAFYIGRHSQCQLVVNDLEVSRRHLKITSSAGGWLIDDLGSTNGTVVNGQRINREKVAPGDRIRIGQTVMVIKRA